MQYRRGRGPARVLANESTRSGHRCRPGHRRHRRWSHDHRIRPRGGAQRRSWWRRDDGGAFPIEDYDQLLVSEIVPLLAELDLEELDQVRAREEQGKAPPASCVASTAWPPSSKVTAQPWPLPPSTPTTRRSRRGRRAVPDRGLRRPSGEPDRAAAVRARRRRAGAGGRARAAGSARSASSARSTSSSASRRRRPRRRRPRRRPRPRRRRPRRPPAKKAARPRRPRDEGPGEEGGPAKKAAAKKAPRPRRPPQEALSRFGDPDDHVAGRRAVRRVVAVARCVRPMLSSTARVSRHRS